MAASAIVINNPVLGNRLSLPKPAKDEIVSIPEAAIVPVLIGTMESPTEDCRELSTGTAFFLVFLKFDSNLTGWALNLDSLFGERAKWKAEVVDAHIDSLMAAKNAV